MTYVNRFYTGIWAVLLALAVGACHDTLLNPEPESILTTANFYETASDVDAAVLGIYNRMQSRLNRDFIVLEAPSDNVYGVYYATSNGLLELEHVDITPDNHEVNLFWQATYNGIFRANSVLANIDRPTNYRASEKDQYIGEAKFMRALFYFDLVRLFGGVPKVTAPLSIAESKEVPRASEEEIYDLIVADLTDAIDKLPRPEAMLRGRASEAAAVALLAKVQVYRGAWAQARTLLERLFTDYDYELVADYGDLFDTVTEDNAEAIFSVAYLEGTNGHGLSSVFAPNEGILGYTLRGSRVVRPTWSLHKHFEEGDQRFRASIWETYLPASAGPEDEPIWYPIVSKYLVPDLGNSDSGMDIPLLRLGDMVLLYAEVLYELGQPDQALTQLNRIRERAFGDTSHNYTMEDIASREAFYDTLLHERRLELAFENQRWFDLVRTGRFTEALGGAIEAEYNPATGTALLQQINVEPHERYFPIPREQIDLASPGVLAQNPGY